MIRPLLTWLACASLVLALAGPLAATEIALGEGTVLRFASVPEGVEAISRRDDYVRQLSPFDRQVRPQTNRAVSEEEFLAFLSRHVAPWTEAEIARLTPLWQDVARKIAPWKLPLPPVILLVKTTGHEEGRAAYCRGAAIMLPQNMVSGTTEKLTSVLPHELFHVLSNQNPELRRELYSTIGFHPCNEVALPGELATRKITNPDAPLNNHYITVERQGRTLDLMPVLFANAPHYDPARGGNLFNYLTFKLMALDGVAGERQPLLVNGQPVLLDPANVPGYHEQIGGNTKYIIHPEEVLADNFVFLINGRIDLPTQRVVERMGQILQAAK